MIKANPLSQEAYSEYGGIIHSSRSTSDTATVNFGSAKRTPNIVITKSHYEKAPSSKPSSTVLSSLVCSPKLDKNLPGAIDPSKRTLTITHLERHPFTSQTFIPIGSSSNDGAYFVVVVDKVDENDSNSDPELDSLKAFVANGDQGMCYAANLWHAPLSVLKETTFAVFQHMNAVEDEDCVWYELPKPIVIQY